MNPIDQIEIKKIDITKLSVDAIVNAANSSLLGGGGVDGAIHQAAGGELLKACKQLRKEQYPQGLATGKAVITAGFNLPAKYVIHTVGPVWKGGNHQEAELLTHCYRRSLAICQDNLLKSVAFPAISTGVYGYPKYAAAKITIATVINWLKKTNYDISIIFALINDNFEIYNTLLKEWE